MALVIRYFSTAAAGAGDGTTWADRAQLHASGTWSSVITGFAFNGSDALECRVGPGTYSSTPGLTSGLFTYPPVAANIITFHGADSSGNRLTPPDPDWVSAQPAWDASGMPVLSTTSSFNLNYTYFRMMVLTGTTATPFLQGTGLDWCQVSVALNGSSSHLINASGSTTNCVLTNTGTVYDMIVRTQAACSLFNCRIVGVTGTSGDRNGIETFAGGLDANRCTIIGGNGYGFTTGTTCRASRCTIVGTGNTGLRAVGRIEGCYVANCGNYGVDANAFQVYLSDSRFRNNTTGNFNGLGNFPTDLNVITAAGTDADEFVNAAGGDYRMKYGSPYWGKGIGAGDGPATIVG